MTAVHPLARNVYFAWLATETEAFDPVRHRRRDLAIKAWDVREEENLQAHTLTLTTAAMPLSALRGKLWAILSYMAPDGTLWPMIRAKRRPVPTTGGFGELGIEFSALPSDWENRQEIGLAPLKVSPYFVGNLVAPERQGDPVEILDARRLVGHFDRVTQAYTTKELLGVGLPVKRLTARDLVGWKDGGGVRVRRTTQPLAGVQGEVSWEWTQADDGGFSVTESLLEAFPGGNVGEPSANGPTGSAQVPSGVVSSLTGESLQSSFPQPGSGVGGSSGYTILTSSITKKATPPGAASRTGTVHGQKARFDFTEDADLLKPIGMKLDIEYFDAELGLGYELRQKRRERIVFFIGNDGVAYLDGKVEKISAKGYDPTVDTNTLPYLPNENVAVGDQRRVGQYVWAAKRGHLTKGSFDQDLYAADGTEQWTLLPTNGSAGGTNNLASFAVTAVGQAAITCVALKAMKKLAISKRGNEVDFIVPLDRWPDVSTGWMAELDLGPAGEQFFEGGTCRGKVISVRIGKSGTRDFAKAAVTIACCDGTGAASPSPAEGVNPTGEPWDGVALSDSVHLPIPATPVPFAVVIVENAPTDQLAYVQANDYTGQPGRDDRTANDPKHLLSDVKTKVTLSCRPISGQPALTLDASLAATPWPGPKQISLPTV